MKTNVRAVLGLLGIGLLAIIVGALTNHPAAASGSAPVTVVNTPLPVNVGTPSVNVANVPTVNLNGVPSVLVANTAVPVRDLDNPDPAANPFQVRLCATTSVFLLDCSSVPNSFTVNSTVRRLVIEYVSGNCATDSTTGVGVVSASIGTTAGGVSVSHTVVQSTGPQNFGTIVATLFAQQTRIYADPGSTVDLESRFFSGSPAPNSFCTLTLSGHILK